MIPYIVFYISIAFILYVYLGYPVLLWLWRRIACRPVKKMGGANASPAGPGYPKKYEPSVSIIVAAYNESAFIERKILNLLALDYPAMKVQIILSLDGPTDDTELLARKHETASLQVLLERRHGGKAGALNRAAAQARGRILVFADARQLLDRTAIRSLVANFVDESVGAVSGELMLLDEAGKEAADAIGFYWRYEKLLRSMESDIHSTMGATGALYAIRRELYRPIPAHTILDDVAIPMSAVLGGKRIVFDRSARAYDCVAASPGAEFTRKVRTLAGNYQLLKQMPSLMVPWRNPVFIQFVSHKIGRLLVPFFLITLFASNLFLEGAAYQAILILQSAAYLMACIGFRATFRTGSKVKGWVLFPYTFVLMNYAAVAGLYHFLRGQPDEWSGNRPVTLPLETTPHRSRDARLSDAA